MIHVGDLIQVNTSAYLATSGVTWMPLLPMPITATFLPFRSRLVSYFAVWQSAPWKLCRPSMSGHFQLLFEELARCDVSSHSHKQGMPYFNTPLPFIKTSAVSMKTSPLSRFLTVTLHTPSPSFHSARVISWLSFMYFRKPCVSTTSLRYCQISPA